MPIFKKKAVRAKGLSGKEKAELKELLLADTSSAADSGIVAIAKRTLAGDLHKDRIGRIEELLERL